MLNRIHSTAVVDPGAELAPSVKVGAYATIGAGVRIGDDTEVGVGAQIQGPTRLGSENRVFPQASIGFEPQDLKYQGEETHLRVGDRNIFREHCTVHRGTGEGAGLTKIGNDNLFMVYTHVAHDCVVGDRTIFSNNATLAGHVDVADDAVVGAFSAVHQFCRVGRHAYIGGFSVITMDALPFAKTVGAKPAFLGMNRIGMERKGVDVSVLSSVERALRILLRSKKNTSQALVELRQELGSVPEVAYLIEFVEGSTRGIIKTLPGKQGARGS